MWLHPSTSFDAGAPCASQSEGRDAMDGKERRGGGERNATRRRGERETRTRRDRRGRRRSASRVRRSGERRTGSLRPANAKLVLELGVRAPQLGHLVRGLALLFAQWRQAFALHRPELDLRRARRAAKKKKRLANKRRRRGKQSKETNNGPPRDIRPRTGRRGACSRT